MRLHSGLVHLLTVPSADAAGARPPRVTANPEHSRSHPLRKLLSSNLDKACLSCSCKPFLAAGRQKPRNCFCTWYAGSPAAAALRTGCVRSVLRAVTKDIKNGATIRPTSELVGLFSASLLRPRNGWRVLGNERVDLCSQPALHFLLIVAPLSPAAPLIIQERFHPVPVH